MRKVLRGQSEHAIDKRTTRGVKNFAATASVEDIVQEWVRVQRPDASADVTTRNLARQQRNETTAEAQNRARPNRKRTQAAAAEPSSSVRGLFFRPQNKTRRTPPS